MLWRAGHLTLDIAEALLALDAGLKDATPYNVLFRGPRPVFVDVLSLEKRATGDGLWLAYAQFVRTFLLPLLANARFGLAPHRVFLGNREGLETAEVYELSGWATRLRPPFLGLVSLPHWLNALEGSRLDVQKLASSKPGRSPETARFVLSRLFRGLRGRLDAFRPKPQTSTWSNYYDTHAYSEASFQHKAALVEKILDESRPKSTLDVGCNTGFFAAIAAKHGDVAAIDVDAAVVGATWERADRDRLPILPLVVDISRPTPALGWRNSEQPSFLDRATGAFDVVLMLAVLHHLLISERVPLDEILGLAARLSRGFAVVEWIPPEDPQFRRVARGRDHLFSGLTRSRFEEACSPFFSRVHAEAIGESGRWLYVLRRTALA